MRFLLVMVLVASVPTTAAPSRPATIRGGTAWSDRPAAWTETSKAPAGDACIVFRIEPVVAATASGVVR